MSKLLMILSATAFFLVIQTEHACAASDVICQSDDHKLVIKFNQFDEDVEFNDTKFQFCSRYTPPLKPISFTRFKCGNNMELKYIDFDLNIQDDKAVDVDFKFSHYHSPDDVDTVEGNMRCN